MPVFRFKVVDRLHSLLLFERAFSRNAFSDHFDQISLVPMRGVSFAGMPSKEAGLDIAKQS